jgi:hypothetical protein
MPVRVEIEYGYGFTKLGMGESYTPRMLAHEFWTLTHNNWNLYPESSFERDIDGTIRHRTTSDQEKFHNSFTVDTMDVPSVKVREDRGLGTAINCSEYQARLLQYWAWSGDRGWNRAEPRQPLDRIVVETRP